MHGEPTGRAVRVGGISVEPGESRTVSLTLPGRSRRKAVDDRLPAHVTVGRRPGPRLTVLGAPRGFEAAAAAAAAELSAETSAAQLDGSIVVVPVLRPGGRFSAGGRPVRAGELWQFPGAVGGARRQREAFVIFSETCVGATAIVLLTAPGPGRVTLPIVRGDVD